MNTTIVRAAGFAAVALAALAPGAPAQAGCKGISCITKPLMDSATQIDPTVNRTMNYKVFVENQTDNILYYAFNGQSSSIGAGTADTWTVRRVGNSQISFDNGRRQQISYDLEPNKRYYFSWNGGVLDLFAK